MEFIQIVEYQTSKIDEIEKVAGEYQEKRAAEGDAPGPAQVTITKDRDSDNVYLTLVRFASYEDAMANSEREDTAELAKAIGALCDGPPKFRNLDVVMEGM